MDVIHCMNRFSYEITYATFEFDIVYNWRIGEGLLNDGGELSSSSSSEGLVDNLTLTIL